MQFKVMFYIYGGTSGILMYPQILVMCVIQFCIKLSAAHQVVAPPLTWKNEIQEPAILRLIKIMKYCPAIGL